MWPPLQPRPLGVEICFISKAFSYFRLWSSCSRLLRLRLRKKMVAPKRMVIATMSLVSDLCFGSK